MIITIIIIIYIINLIVLHLGGHHTEELGELDHPVPILVKLVDQVLKISNAGFECKIKRENDLNISNACFKGLSKPEEKKNSNNM